MSKQQKVVLGLVVLALAGVIIYFSYARDVMRKANVMRIQEENKAVGSKVDTGAIANTGPISAFSGVSCENWNRRPIAVMQPADFSARPPAGFSDADMVFEMPVITSTINRLMAVYQCTFPKEVGAVRSSRHDFLHIAKSINAVYVHWGGSHFALEKIKEGILDNIDCTGAAGNSAGSDVCFRTARKPGMKSEDTSRVNVEAAFERSKALGYGLTNTFVGYPHQAEAPLSDRPASAYLRIGYPGPGEVEYFYDKESNQWKRLWGNVEDVDRNNGVRIAPKNIAVLFAESEQIEGQYNNMKFGDPWYDQVDSGDAYYYMNGKQAAGKWKKDRADIASKLLFLDADGNEVRFIPGQVWVNLVEPGTGYKFE